MRADKREQKAKLAKWKAEQRAIARSKLPLENTELKAMFDMLARELRKQGCDKTLRLVRDWCREQSIDFNRVDAWLMDNRGFCDCEALANAEQNWLDAIHDSQVAGK